MKKIGISVILILLLASPVFAYAWQTYDYSKFERGTYVYDTGGNFKDIDLDYYNGVFRDMESRHGITYVFVIVGDYDITEPDDTVWDFAALIREKAGYSGDFISAAVTIGPGGRDFAIYTHGKGQAVMNDDYVDGMYDAVIKHLRENDWDGAFLTFADLAEKMTVSYYEDTYSIIDGDGNVITMRQKEAEAFDFAQTVLWALIAGTAVTLAALISEFGKHKPVKKAVHADFYVNDENVQMNVAEDRYIRSHEVRTKVSSSSSGGGSGRSGGSSRTGSSGRSGGGRSGRF